MKQGSWIPLGDTVKQWQGWTTNCWRIKVSNPKKKKKKKKKKEEEEEEVELSESESNQIILCWTVTK
jgi:hypothetical protein